MAYEIEKRWLVDETPYPSQYSKIECCEVETFYGNGLSSNFSCRFQRRTPDDGIPKYTMTVKLGHGVLRTEIQTEISQKDYSFAMEALKISPDMVIKKDYCKYYNVDGTEYNLEVNIVDDKFTYLEIEFKSLCDLYQFEHGSDVCYRDCFLNKLNNPRDVTNSFSMADYWLQKLQNGK